MWTHHQKRQRRKHEAAKRHYERQQQATGTAVHGEEPQVRLGPGCNKPEPSCRLLLLRGLQAGCSVSASFIINMQALAAAQS